MKLNREQVTEMYGSVPDEQDGKNLVGVEFKNPKAGDMLFHENIWVKAHHDQVHSHPVAIYDAAKWPTTLEDLVSAKTPIVYIHEDNGDTSPLNACFNGGELRLMDCGGNVYTLNHLLSTNRTKKRFSNSPFTVYEDANLFIT
jgi:hypothetical protein